MINKNYLCIVFLSDAAFCRMALMLYIIMTDISTLAEVSTPIYIMEESRLRRNLELISGVARDADVEIILAFKAFALLAHVSHLPPLHKCHYSQLSQ